MADDETLCMQITQQIMAYEGDLATLEPPLNDVIDMDALEQLFHSADRDSRVGSTVTFSYCGYRVTVDSAGTVDVVPHDTESVPARQRSPELTP